MPTVLPFHGLRYAPALSGQLDRLIAPPYDVINEERRLALAARHPNNIVHLDLPASSEGEEPHARAKRLLREWIDSRVLVRGERPAFFLCEQRFVVENGEPRVRRGIFARLRLERFEDGVVIPHERTLEGPRRDRERLLAATRTHLSPVFMLHPDPGGAVAATLARLAGSPGMDAARDDDGVGIRVGRIEAEDDVTFLKASLGRGWALIADGHHRYESALAYRERRRAAGARDAEHVLVFLCSLEDSGLSIFPIHRLIHSLSRFDPNGLRERLAGSFRLGAVAGPTALAAALRSKRGRPGTFGLLFSQEPECWLAEWIEGAGLDQAGLADVPEAFRRLDVVLLHRLILEAALGITPEAQARQTHLDYVKDEAGLFSRLAEGKAQLGVLLNPTSIEQVVEVTRQKLRLPQKSTFFYPKVPTGLVLDPLDG